jgi:hypothetical protein
LRQVIDVYNMNWKNYLRQRVADEERRKKERANIEKKASWRTSSRPDSIFSARATIWCAAAAFEAFAPKRAACSCFYLDAMRQVIDVYNMNWKNYLRQRVADEERRKKTSSTSWLMTISPPL